MVKGENTVKVVKLLRKMVLSTVDIIILLKRR